MFFLQIKKRALKTAIFEFLFEYNGDYIRISSTPIHTYLTSSMQSLLQNQMKQERNEKDNYNFISLIL